MNIDQENKTAYLEALQAEVDALVFASLPNISDQLDYLLKRVYLAYEKHRAHAEALDCCPDTLVERKQALKKVVDELERRLHELTREAHEYAYNNFRIPFYHDQVILAACKDFAWEYKQQRLLA